MDGKGKRSAEKIDLSQGSVGRLILKLAIPTITAQLVNVLYNMVDRMYIGHLPDVGSEALTGLGVTFPVITIISAFSALVSMGGAPRASIMLGMGERDKAENVLGNCTFALMAMSAVLTAIFTVYGREVLLAFGASANTIGYAWEYMRIYTMGTVFVQFSLGLNTFINAQGYTATGMMTVMIGAICNIVLDPIFIFVLGMGVRGAALATVISQGISAAWVVAFLTVGKSYLRIRRRHLKAEWGVLAPAMALGLSPFTMQFTESALNVCFNTSLLKYGGDIAVGAMAILHSVMNFAFLVLQGLGQGVQPIVSFNYGAGRVDRVKRAYRIFLTCCLGFALTVWCMVQFAPLLPVSVFTQDAELAGFSAWALRIYMFSFPFMGMQTSCQQSFVALGNAKTSLFVALLRKVFLLIPLIYILPCFFSDKVFAVFLAEPMTDMISGTCAMFLFTRYYRKISGGSIFGRDSR